MKNGPYNSTALVGCGTAPFVKAASCGSGVSLASCPPPSLLFPSFDLTSHSHLFSLLNLFFLVSHLFLRFLRVSPSSARVRVSPIMFLLFLLHFLSTLTCLSLTLVCWLAVSSSSISSPIPPLISSLTLFCCSVVSLPLSLPLCLIC